MSIICLFIETFGSADNLGNRSEGCVDSPPKVLKSVHRVCHGSLWRWTCRETQGDI